MVNIERPCCETPLSVSIPLPDVLACEDCRVSWVVVDPEPEVAALAA